MTFETDAQSLSLQAGSILPGYSISGHREYKARFVKAGRVRSAGNKPSKIVVEAQALEQAAASGMFDDKAVFVDHAGWFDYPSLERLVGVNGATFAVQGARIEHDAETDGAARDDGRVIGVAGGLSAMPGEFVRGVHT